MIRPKPKPGLGRPKGAAIGLTVVLLVATQAALEGIPVPAFASSRDVIRELDPLIFERLAPPPPPAEEAPEVIEDVVPEETADEAPSLTLEEEVSQAMDELDRLFATEDAAPPSAARAGEADEPAVPGISTDVASERFESLFGGGAEPVAGRAARGRVGGPAGRGGVGVGITERRTDPESATGPEVTGPDVSVRTGAERTDAAAASDLEIREYESESFDRTEADRLADWMRSNPADLPIGVRVHVNYEPSFLTSVAGFSSEGRSWELYVMLNETLQELHIVLVEENRSVYLIDRGFQEQSRSLREGTVRRTRGEIVAVDSRTGAASSERAQEFYNVFLSWWDATKGS